MLGNWPLEDAVWKSFDNCVSWLARLVLPSEVAVCAALARFVEICPVTWEY